jgi:hypothetical protein
MPDREVQTIKDLIYFQYAKVIGKTDTITGFQG